MLTQFSARAFKGLRSFSIAPQAVNLLIGANGTGKTNFADLIAFVVAVCQRGLSAAIENAGGLEHMRTRQPSAGTPYRFRIELRLGEDVSRGIKEAHYAFELAQLKDVIKVRQETLQAIVYKRKPGKPSRADAAFRSRSTDAIAFSPRGHGCHGAERYHWPNSKPVRRFTRTHSVVLRTFVRRNG